jgi:hypothetical protein
VRRVAQQHDVMELAGDPLGPGRAVMFVVLADDRQIAG